MVSVDAEQATKDRVLVTGCSSGIGHALVGELTARGWHVIATARTGESLADLACAERFALDVTSQASIDALAQQVGAVGVVVNNAGVGMWGPVETVDVETARTLFDTNVFGALRVAQAFLPSMRERGRGLIVQISSAAGRSTSPLVGIYSASKHALEAMSEALRIELAAFGVKVTCVSLGAVASAFGDNRANFDSSDYSAVSAHFRNRLMSRRTTPTSAEEAAAAIADVIEEGGAQFRYDVTEDSRTIVAARRALSDADYEASLVAGLLCGE